MRNFPSKKAIIFTLAAVISYLTVDFIINIREDFFQLNYDWKSKKIIKSIEGIELDTLSYSVIKLNLPGNIKQLEEKLSTNYSFALNDRYYFRCNSIRKIGNKIDFNGVFWINDTPKSSFRPDELSIIDMPLLQEGNWTICMLGDSQITWREGKYTRKNIVKNIRDIRFIGDNVDVFGYPHQASTLNNTHTISNHLEDLPNAETYILFVGAHETDHLETGKNLETIVSFLLNKVNHIVLVVPPARKTKKNDRVLQIIRSTYLKYEENDKVKIIDLSKELSSPDPFLMSDGIHLNRSGHERLTKLLIDALKQHEDKF